MKQHYHRPVEKAHKRQPLITYVGGAAILGSVALLFSLVIVDLVQNWKMRGWPYVEATLVERSLTVVNRSESRWEPGIDYRADYVLRYPWQGQIYYAHDQSLLKMSGSDRRLWEFRNAIGTKKVVRLNPRNPADPTLKWGISWAYDVAIGSSAVALLVVGLLWLYRPAKR